MQKPKHEVADVIRLYGSGFEQQYNPVVQVKKTLRALTYAEQKPWEGM